MPASRQALGIVFAILLLDVLGIGLVAPVLPGLVTEISGGTPAEAARWFGPLLATYAVMQFLFAPVVGALSDRFGRRPVLLVSVAMLGVDYVIQALAPTLLILFLGRALAGVAGSSITTAASVLADLSTPETRARNFGLIGAAFGLGFILGPATGGLLAEISLRAPFVAAACLSAVNLVVAWVVLPETLPAGERRPFSFRTANPIASLGRLAAMREISWLIAALTLAALAQRSLESVWVLHATIRYGWDARTNGLTLALLGLLTAISQGYLIRKAVPRLGEATVIQMGLALWSLAFVIYGVASAPWILLSAMPVGALGALAQPALAGRIAGSVSPSQQGALQGGLSSIRALTAAVAPLVANALLAWGEGADLTGLPFLAGAAVLALAWLAARRGLS